MDIRTSWVQNNWLVKKFHSPLRFLAPRIWSSFDLSAFDVVISSSGWFMCRGVKVAPPAVHVCYIHHPPRNLYGYATGGMWQRYWPVRIYTSIINFFLRQYDFRTAQAVDYFVANSQETARRVEKFYRRASTVIYPPVSLSQKTSSGKKERTYFLTVGRLAWSKQTDIIIKAANALHIPLKIVGTGPEEDRLKALAGPTVEFMGAVSDEELATIYAGARATIFAALAEDFGIVPVESQAAGTPVIALAQGGVLETVVDGKTGVLFDAPTEASLTGAIKRFMTLSKKQTWEAASKAQAQKFSEAQFKKTLAAFVTRAAAK
jgi:glycosyltransferase involved in cell wall biosynthesis